MFLHEPRERVIDDDLQQAVPAERADPLRVHALRMGIDDVRVPQTRGGGGTDLGPHPVGPAEPGEMPPGSDRKIHVVAQDLPLTPLAAEEPFHGPAVVTPEFGQRPRPPAGFHQVHREDMHPHHQVRTRRVLDDRRPGDLIDVAEQENVVILEVS